jgi:hypothetical protein
VVFAGSKNIKRVNEWVERRTGKSDVPDSGMQINSLMGAVLGHFLVKMILGFAAVLGGLYILLLLSDRFGWIKP